MKISEIFFSIQGEGQWLGCPSVFIRTSGCNLRCRWCDTPYASWNPEGTEMTVGEIIGKIAQYPTDHVVITGGEPLIHEDIVTLAAELKFKKKLITLETAGTIWRDMPLDLASISPKLSNSTPWNREEGRFARSHEVSRINHDVLARFMEAPVIKAVQWKFVVCSPEDVKEIEALLLPLSASKRFRREDIFLMPEGIDTHELNEKGRWIAEICKSGGYRFGSRLHIALYGNKRGV